MVVRELLVAMGFNLDESKVKRADQSISSIKDHAESAAVVVGRLAAVLGVVFGSREVIQMADAWTNVYAKIGIVTQSAAEQAAIQKEIFEIAQRTRQEYESTGALYYKMALFSKELNASQRDVLDVTETVNKALVVGGASKMEANSTILQLSQALASGFLQGDELRALRENAPLLMAEMAKYLGTTIGGLKEMGAQGELSSEKVFKAILSAKAKIDAQFKKMPVTVEQSVTYALNRIGSLIFGINKETSVFQALAKRIQQAADGIAEKIENVTKKVGGMGNAMKLATIAAASFITAFNWQAIVAGIGAIRAALGALLLNPVFLAITVAVATLALVLDDLYAWMTGKASIAEETLGSFEKFRPSLEAFVKTLGELQSVVGMLSDNMTALELAIKAIQLAAEVSLQPLKALLETLRFIHGIIQDIKGGKIVLPDFTGGVAPIGLGPSYGVSPAALAGAGSGGPVTITTGDVNIEQNIAGAGQQLVNDVGTATSSATGDAMNKWARDLQFAM